MEKKYLRYVGDFKKRQILRMIGCGIGVLMLILIMFLPLFQWKMERSFQNLLGIRDSELSFSLFDEMQLAFDQGDGKVEENLLVEYVEYMRMFEEESIWDEVASESGSYFSSISGWIILAAFLGGLFFCGWQGIKLYAELKDIDGVAVEEYDKMRWRQDEDKNKQKQSTKATGAISFIGAMFGLSLLIKILDSSGYSYFGADGWDVRSSVWLIVFLAVGGICVDIYAKNIRREIQRKVIKEDYEDKPAVEVFTEMQTPQAPQATPATAQTQYVVPPMFAAQQGASAATQPQQATPVTAQAPQTVAPVMAQAPQTVAPVIEQAPQAVAMETEAQQAVAEVEETPSAEEPLLTENEGQAE